MDYNLYILSNPDGRYYIGYTGDIDKRLKKHNKGDTKSTKNRGKWKVAYTEKFETKTEAVRREKYIKRQKSREFIKSLIHRGVEK
jgi:putative endonuclease